MKIKGRKPKFGRLGIIMSVSLILVLTVVIFSAISGTRTFAGQGAVSTTPTPQLQLSQEGPNQDQPGTQIKPKKPDGQQDHNKDNSAKQKKPKKPDTQKPDQNKPDKSNKPNMHQQDPHNITVYVVKGGSHYHMRDCPFLKHKKNIRAISLYEAKKRGFKRCHTCHPPK